MVGSTAFLSKCGERGNCVMESSVIELSKYRFQCACEDLNDAKLLMDTGSFKSSANRSYYYFDGYKSMFLCT